MVIPGELPPHGNPRVASCCSEGESGNGGDGGGTVGQGSGSSISSLVAGQNPIRALLDGISGCPISILFNLGVVVRLAGGISWLHHAPVIAVVVPAGC